MVSLTDISNQIFFQFRDRQFKSLEKKRLGIFHVTDYTKVCMRNTYYNHLAGGKKSMDTETMSHFFGGEAVHQLLDSVVKGRKIQTVPMGEDGMAWDFINDKKITLYLDNGDVNPEITHYTREQWIDILVGERDSVYEVTIKGKKELVMVDYKTWLSKGYPKKSPSEDHVLQVNLYRYLFNKIYGIDVKYGAVIYLDFGDKMQKPLVFMFELEPVVKTLAELITKHDYLVETHKTGTLPPRVYSWLCNGYCNFAQRCVSEEKLSPEDNKLQVNI